MGRIDADGALDEITEVEFREWRRFYGGLYPIDRDDLRVAVLGVWICRILAAGLGVKPADLGLAEGFTIETFAFWNEHVVELMNGAADAAGVAGGGQTDTMMRLELNKAIASAQAWG
jgi:hypothetical protein